MSDQNSSDPVGVSVSIFQLVRVAALRAKQLRDGARPRVEPNGNKIHRVAVREVEAGLVSWGVADLPVGAEKSPAKA